MLLDTAQINKLLPHRAPMLMVDRVTDYIPGQRLMACRAVSIAEPCFQGHFPGLPLFPAVLTTEALAQTCALFELLERLEWRPGAAIPDARVLAETVGVLGATRLRFPAPVTPGCILELSATLEKRAGRVAHFEVLATENDRTVAKGTILVAETPAESLALPG